MTQNLALMLAMRWIHILSVVVAIGGVFYLRVILWPAAQATLTPDQFQALRERLTARWRMIVHGLVALLLISGLYQYLAVTRPLHDGQPLYHMLFGIKFLLALAVFFLAETLVSRRAWSAAIRASAPFYLALLLVVATAIILISGGLKTMPQIPVESAPSAMAEGR